MLLALSLAGCVFLPREDPEPATGGRPAVTAAPAQVAAAEPVRIPGVADGTDFAPLTLIELQTEMLSFTDRYLEAIAEACDKAGIVAADPGAGAEFHEVKVIYATAAVSIASLPDARRVLREFIVSLRLQRLVWADGGPPWSPPPASALLENALTRTESELVELAQRAMPAEAIATIQDLAGEWMVENSGRTYVAFVRFSDLGNPQRRRSIVQQSAARGFLAPVSEASRQLEEIRAISERAVFLANHLPLLVEWQAESFVSNTLQLPELRSLLADSRRVALAAEQVGVQLDVAFDRLAAERAAAISDLGETLARERTAALADLRRQTTGLLVELDQSTENLLPLAEALSTAAGNLGDAATIIGELSNAGTESEVDLIAIGALAESLTGFAETTASMIVALRELLAVESSGTAVEGLDALLRRHERRLFVYSAMLIVLTGVVALAVILLGRRFARR